MTRVLFVSVSLISLTGAHLRLTDKPILATNLPRDQVTGAQLNN